MVRTPDNTGGETPTPRANFDILGMTGWSSLVSPESMPARDDSRIVDINKYPRARLMESDEPGQTQLSSDPAVVAAAYYSLELSTGLMPFPELITYKSGTGAERDDVRYAEGAAVARELMSASKLYAYLKRDRHVMGDDMHRLQHNVEEFTRSQEEANASALKVIRMMRRSNAFRQSLNTDIAREAEHIIKMLMAKELGKIVDYSDLLRYIFPDESEVPAETEVVEETAE